MFNILFREMNHKFWKEGLSIKVYSVLGKAVFQAEGWGYNLGTEGA